MKFRYEYLTSEGPKIGKDFQNPDENLAYLADGKWHVNQEKTEDASESDADNLLGEESREYLIITRWDYNPYNDEMVPNKEYVIDKPAVKNGNIRPLMVSKECGVAYFFELDDKDNIMYCEIDLTQEDDEGNRYYIKYNMSLSRKKLFKIVWVLKHR